MKNNNRFRLDVWGITTLLLLAFYLLFMVYPFGNVIKMAFYDNKGGGFTLNNFIKFFSKTYYSVTLVNSFKVSFWATVCSLLIGIPMAYFFTMYKIVGQKTLRLLIIISSMSAPFVGAYAWILLLGRNGSITRFIEGLLHITLPDIYGFNGMLLVFTSQLYSLVFLYVTGALSKLDNSLLEASENMGCTGLVRFFKVVMPLIMPTNLAAALLVFIRALSDFGTPMLMGEGYRTFPVILYNEFVGEVSQNKGFSSAIAVIAILITTVVFVAQTIATKKTSFSMNSLHPIEAKKIHGMKSALIHFFVYAVVGISMLPQIFVVYCSFRKTSGTMYMDGFSLASYQEMMSRLGSSVRNTILIPSVALVITVFMAVLMAYLSVRRSNPMTKTVDTLSMVPYIIPGTVVGIAMVTSFNHRPLVLTNTMTIMVIALIIRRLPYTVRSSVAVLHQIPMSIEEAALSLGSTKLKTFFKITLPMMSSGVVAGAILSWVNMISEMSTAMILYTGKTQTLTVAVYGQIIRGNYGIASAMASVLTILTIISLVIFNLFNKKGEITM